MTCGANLRFRFRLKRATLAALTGLAIAGFTISCEAAGPAYATSGDCGGFPKANLTTPAGWCVGVVAGDLRFPRGMSILPNGDLIVAELGGWVENRGRLSILRKAKGYARETLFEKLNQPHGVVVGPDKLVYVGVVGSIFRFDPANPEKTRTDVIGGKSGVAGPPGNGRHPLTNFVFDAKGDLLVNVGSASDNCDEDKGATCAEAKTNGQIRRYPVKDGRASAFKVEADGLRNSLALALHRASGNLWQAENSRDGINKRDPKLNDNLLPHDELNLVVAGRNYGWPYCYDNKLPSPEFPSHDCKGTTAPVLLLPPHAAPLGMAIDNDAKLPAPYTGHMLIGYHGYRKTGHRVVALKLDARGMPAGEPVDLISGWDAGGEGKPLGAPVEVRIAPDGAIFITEDRNRTILRLIKP